MGFDEQKKPKQYQYLTHKRAVEAAQKQRRIAAQIDAAVDRIAQLSPGEAVYDELRKLRAAIDLGWGTVEDAARLTSVYEPKLAEAAKFELDRRLRLVLAEARGANGARALADFETTNAELFTDADPDVAESIRAVIDREIYVRVEPVVEGYSHQLTAIRGDAAGASGLVPLVSTFKMPGIKAPFETYIELHRLRDLACDLVAGTARHPRYTCSYLLSDSVNMIPGSQRASGQRLTDTFEFVGGRWRSPTMEHRLATVSMKAWGALAEGVTRGLHSAGYVAAALGNVIDSNCW